MDKSVTASQNAVAGATAGVISRLVIAPLDVVKIRLQIQSSAKPILSASFRNTRPPPKYTGIIQSMALIVREEGVKGLWKGNWPAEYLYLTYGAVQFLVYHEWQKSTAGLLPETPRSFIGGAISGCVATFATYPLDLLRTRFAMQGASRIYTSLYGACREIHQTEGIPGFYRGVWPSILQIAPYMGIMFAVQGKLSETFERIENPYWNHAWDHFTSGGVAGMLSKTAVMPFDVVRKRLQVQGPSRKSYILSDIPRYTGGFFACARQIAVHEGLGALYKGLWPGLVKTAPSSAITFWVVGECRRMFGAYNERTPLRQ
ncbi:mitochondrial thiamine pyrophosphate transporter [Chytriomyces hyalinus]|nr:mitochondrial thiamine pyrophosphate transporter [Chytriomyces hyalinus]